MTVLVNEVVETIVIEHGQQGIPGPPGLDGAGVLQVDTDGVLTATTVVVDSVLATLVRSVKWLVTVIDTVTGAQQSFEVYATKTLADVEHQVFGRVGDVLDVNTNVVFQSSSLQLQITNNEANPIDVQALRIATAV